LNDTLKRYLEDLEKRIDPEGELRLLAEWTDFAEGRFRGGIFSPRRTQSRPPSFEWPTVHINGALEDFDLMCLQQYRICSERLAAGDGALLSVRANYGTSIIALLFGVEPFIMPAETDTLPTTVPLHDAAAVRRIVGLGLPDLNAGYGSRVFEMGERFRAIGREYPNIGRHVHIYHPDAQGPLDICEVIWGCEIFLAFYDEPDLVKALLELVTDTYAAFMRAWGKIVPFRKGSNVHWDIMHKGSIMLRDDSAMNISPALFDEFVVPYDQRLLAEFGGGAIHFCGRGDHFIPRMSRIKGLHAVNLSQPELNNMEIIFANTIDKGINLVDLAPEAAAAARKCGRPLRGRVHSKPAGLHAPAM